MSFENYSKAAFQKNERELEERKQLEDSIQALIPDGAGINGPNPRAEREALLASAYDQALEEDGVRNIDDEWGLQGQRLQEKYRVVDAVPEEPAAVPEQVPIQIDNPIAFDDIELVETAKGSTYRYLPNGMTQRFKKVEGREYEPQSVLVYVPDYAWIKANAPQEVLEKLGENETLYTDTLLEYVQNPRREGKGAYVIDGTGKKIETNTEIRETEGPIYLALTNGVQADFQIPVSRVPKVGYMTFDTRHYIDEKTGTSMRERHLGNAVTRIVRKEKPIMPSIDDTVLEELDGKEFTGTQSSPELPVSDSMVQATEVDTISEQSLGKAQEFEKTLRGLKAISPLSSEQERQYRENFRTNPNADSFKIEREFLVTEGSERVRKMNDAVQDFLREMKRWDRDGNTPLIDRLALENIQKGAEALAVRGQQSTAVIWDALEKIRVGISTIRLETNGKGTYNLDAFRKFSNQMSVLSDVLQGVAEEFPGANLDPIIRTSADLRDFFKKKYATGSRYLNSGW